MRWTFSKAIILVLLFAGVCFAYRFHKPFTFQLPWTTGQMANLNTLADDVWNLQQGLYEADIVTTPKTNANNGEFWILDNEDTTINWQVKALDAVHNIGGGAATSPGGSDTHVQYNNGGNFGGNTGFTYDDALGHVFIGGSLFLPTTSSVDGRILENEIPLLHGYGTNNMFLGGAGNYTLTAVDNFGVGTGVLVALTSGNYNVAIGNTAATAITSGDDNICIGRNSCDSITYSDDNVCLGENTCAALVDNDDDNIAIGENALTSAYSESGNIAIGRNALTNYTSTGQPTNICIGYDACDAMSAEGGNVALGEDALGAATGVSDSTALGNFALGNMLGSTKNVAVGYEALEGTGDNKLSHYNVAVGFEAMKAADTASYNTAIGYQVAPAITTGDYNTFVGSESAKIVTAGSYNVYVGADIATQATTGNDNTIMGYNAGHELTTGYQNIFLGRSAGYEIDTGYNVIAIGWRVGFDGDFTPSTITNSIGIGSEIHIEESNMFRLGSKDIRVATGNISGPANYNSAQFTMSGINAGITLNVIGSGHDADLILGEKQAGEDVFRVHYDGKVSAAGGSAGKATCWKADGITLGYCSDAVDGSGDCTCN